MIDTFADMIRHHRLKLKLTMDKLAELSNVHKSTISKIECGEVRKPELHTIKSLAQPLEISYDVYIRIYVSIERNSDTMLDFLLEAISFSSPASLTIEIASRYLELPNLDSDEAIAKIFTTANDVKDTSIRLELFKKVVSYSREHGVMTYIARGMYQVYMIERNDFTKLETTYQSGKGVLAYVEFLNTDEQINFYYCLENHAYALLKYNESIEFSQYSAHATYNICSCLYYLNEFIECKRFLNEYQKYSFSFVKDNVQYMTGCINGQTDKLELGIEQLEQYLRVTSQFNLVYTVTMLMDLYLIKSDVVSARNLLEYEVEMKNSLNDKYTTPDKKARMAYFYRLAGNALLSQDEEKAFDYYLKSALDYMRISLYDNALESIILINNAILEENSRLSTKVIMKINDIFKQIVNKKS